MTIKFRYQVVLGLFVLLTACTATTTTIAPGQQARAVSHKANGERGTGALSLGDVAHGIAESPVFAVHAKPKSVANAPAQMVAQAAPAQLETRQRHLSSANGDR